MRLTLLAGIAVVGTLAACAQPGTKPHPISAQFKNTNVQHWRELAGGLAASVPAKVAESEHLYAGHMFESASGPQDLAKRKAYYVHPAAPDMPFSAEFKPLLEAALLEQGYLVSTTPRDAIVINFDADTFFYDRATGARQVADYGTVAGMVWAAGVAISENESWSTFETGVTGLAVGVLGDFLGSLSDTTDAEVVLKTTVTDGRHLALRDVEIFYIEPADLPFYWSRFAERPPVATDPMHQAAGRPQPVGFAD